MVKVNPEIVIKKRRDEKMNGQMIRTAQELLRKAMENLRQDVGETLDNVPPLGGVRPVSGPVRSAVVSFSAISSSPNLVLSPSYFLQGCQTEAVSSYLLADDISFDTFQERLKKCIAKKSITVKGEQTFLNLNTVAALESIQMALKM